MNPIFYGILVGALVGLVAGFSGCALNPYVKGNQKSKINQQPFPELERALKTGLSLHIGIDFIPSILREGGEDRPGVDIVCEVNGEHFCSDFNFDTLHDALKMVNDELAMDGEKIK